MDHREPARIGAPEPDDRTVAGPRGLVRLVGDKSTRRFAFGRLAFWVLAGVASLALLLTGGAGMMRSSVAWLHRQDAYRLNFADITLDPPPPPWIKSGAAGLLERVRRRARRPEQISALELDLGELGRDFARESPWFLSVDRVERGYPNRLTVRATYRRPVAVVRLGAFRILLDKEGIVLPEDDIDLSAAGPLIDLPRILPAETDAAAVEALPGKAFRVLGSERGEAVDESVRVAARIAGFFVEIGANKPEAKVVVRAVHRAGGQFYVETAQETMILWVKDSELDDPGSLGPRARWDRLIEWAERHSLGDVKHPAFLEFDGDRVVVHVPKRG